MSSRMNLLRISLLRKSERPLPTYSKWAFVVLLIPLLCRYAFNEVLDHKFSLCSVRCRHVYGQESIPSLDRNITGNRPIFFPDRCDCNGPTPSSKTPKFIGSVSWHELRRPGSLSDNVCGADGQGYPSQQEACINDTYPLHGGTCGACSNNVDLDVYRQTRQTMSLLAYKCMVKYLYDSEQAAHECFQVTGLTNGCSRCWIDNMKCTASSCLLKCIWHNVINNLPWTANTTLNPCIQCDEELCGPAFVQCAGANRRRAGIVSDITRPHFDVWNRTAC